MRSGAAKMATHFKALGVDHGDRIAFVLNAGPEMVMYMMGAGYCGAAICIREPQMDREQTSIYLDTVQPKLIITDPKLGWAKGGRSVRFLFYYYYFYEKRILRALCSADARQPVRRSDQPRSNTGDGL